MFDVIDEVKYGKGDDNLLEIPLTQGKKALVDKEDYKRLNKYSWHFDQNGYAYRRKSLGNGKSVLVSMHREVLGIIPKRKVVDHINRDKLDNRRGNLRITSQSNNSANSPPRKGTSEYKGVHWNTQAGKWSAKIERLGIYYSLGLFYCEDNAALAYNEKAEELFGEYAYLNEVPVSEIDYSKEYKASSDFEGVSYVKSVGRWRSYLRKDGKQIHLGNFGCEIDAARMYNFWAHDIYGRNAKLNMNVEVV